MTDVARRAAVHNTEEIGTMAIYVSAGLRAIDIDVLSMFCGYRTVPIHRMERSRSADMTGGTAWPGQPARKGGPMTVDICATAIPLNSNIL